MKLHVKEPRRKIFRERAFTFLFIFTMFQLCIVSRNGISSEASFEQTDLFISGTEGYHTFRIPSLISSPNGTILAFCEGRKDGGTDSGEIHIVLKRSYDGAMTWEPLEILWSDGENACGNPCCAVDQDTGTIWLFSTHNLGQDSFEEIVSGVSDGTRTVWVMESSDNGESWTEPWEVTETTKLPFWTWYATGPGVGIQTSGGRLVIPCDFVTSVNFTAQNYVLGSHCIYSDDHGINWKLGGFVCPLTNESQVVELSDGRLLLNMRNYSVNKIRAFAVSEDSGDSWSRIRYDKTLVEPRCQASILRYSQDLCKEIDPILFSNPAAETRVNMTVRISYDNCLSWPIGKVIYSGPSAYSCLAVLPDQTIACLYERGDSHPYEKITLAAFTMDWLTQESTSETGESGKTILCAGKKEK